MTVAVCHAFRDHLKDSKLLHFVTFTEAIFVYKLRNDFFNEIGFERSNAHDRLPKSFFDAFLWVTMVDICFLSTPSTNVKSLERIDSMARKRWML